MVPDTIFWINFWTPKKNELLIEICIRSLKGQYGSNRNVPDAVFWQIFEQQMMHELQWKFLYDPWKDNMGQTVFSQLYTILINFWAPKSMSFRWKFVLDPWKS